jgi:hypothetical protein
MCVVSSPQMGRGPFENLRKWIMKDPLGRLLAAALLLWSAAIWASSYSDTVSLFKNAGQGAAFFDKCLWVRGVSHQGQ